MKNLFLSAALILGTTFMASASVYTADAVISINQEKEYKKIETSQVPVEVLQRAGTKYDGYALNEAYVSADGEYKLVLSKDGKTINAIYSATGDFVKEA